MVLHTRGRVGSRRFFERGVLWRIFQGTPLLYSGRKTPLLYSGGLECKNKERGRMLKFVK